MKSQKREIIIGDVHGCFEELKELLELIQYSPLNDELLFLGDLINKGPYSQQVLDFVIQGRHRCLMGNHEMGFLRALRDETYMKGGFLKLKERMGDKLSYYQEWMEELPYYIETDDYIAVHGGLEPNVSLEDQRPEIITRIRTWDGSGEDMNDLDNPSWFDLYEDDKLVVFGHWAAHGLVRRRNVIGLDTGCVWGGALSCLILPEMRIESIPAHKMYRTPSK